MEISEDVEKNITNSKRLEPKSHRYFFIGMVIIGFIIIIYLLYINGESIYERGI